jgi:hypothetical protein
MDNDLITEFFADEIGRCEDIQDFKNEILPRIASQQEQWKFKINEIISKTGYSKSEFSNLCGVSRMTVNKWCNGAIPKNRETFIRIGMAAHYNIDDMNRLLTRYGKYPALYSKSLEDCICIYVLQNYSGENAFEKYEYILNRIKDNIVCGDEAGTQESTAVFDEKLAQVKDEYELECFITDNAAAFTYSYHRFYAYVNMLVEANYGMYATSISDMADGQEWSSSLRQCVSAIRQKKWYPTRNKIISLGIHLNQDHEQIDQMLTLAHMEKLCSKNIFESVIMFILDDACMNGMLETEDEYFDPDALCLYVKEVIEELNLPELEFFIAELPEVEDV